MTPVKAQSDRPNIVWIVLDACRASNLSCYGYERPTSPNIDALADRGVLFENNYTQGLWTIISVPSYMTGRYMPVACIGNPAEQRPRVVPPTERLLPEILKANGYTSIGVSSHWGMIKGTRFVNAFDDFVLEHPAGYEEDTWCQTNYAPADVLYRSAVDLLLEQDLSKPFFLYLHLLDTHFPHCIPGDEMRWSTSGYESDNVAMGSPIRKRGSTFTDRDVEELRGLYDDSIRYADAYVGKLLGAFEQLGIRDNTVFIIASDHGDALGEDGSNWGHTAKFGSDEVLHVPLIIAGPDISAGTRIQDLTENADIVPTLVDLLGLDTDATFDGRSLVPALKGVPSPDPPRFYTYSRATDFADWLEHVVRTPDLKMRYQYFEKTSLYYDVPDPLTANRTTVEPSAIQKARFQAILDDDIIPLTEAYYGQPPLFHEIFISSNNRQGFRINDEQNVVRVADELPNDSHTSDGKWTLTRKGLWAASWAEAPAALELEIPVPDGSYSLIVSWYVQDDVLGRQTSTIKVRPPGGNFVTLSQTPGEGVHFLAYKELGVFEISGGLITLGLNVVEGDHWAVLDKVYLFPLGEGRFSAEDLQIQKEQMEALGYTD